MNAQRYKLENGLVLWLNRQIDDEAYICVGIRYGELDEVPNAHLLEHIIYDRMAEGFARSGLEAKGAQIYAGTALDHTEIKLKVPKRNTVDALEILALSLVKERLTEEELNTAKKDVIN